MNFREETVETQQALYKDQVAKSQIVVDVITEHCHRSPHGDLRAIAHALDNGDRLVAKVLSGGKTNFSYKVHLAQNTRLAVFAKVAFPYALWNNDRSVVYKTERLDSEYVIMNYFKTIMGNDGAPVATPYLCVAVGDLKVLVTAWASADEQWANQFIDGAVDRRIIAEFARALATLNCAQPPSSTKTEPLAPEPAGDSTNFNEHVRAVFDSCMDEIADAAAAAAGNPAAQDKAAQLLRDIGTDEFRAMMEAMKLEYKERQVLVHNDCHCFNILVEKKPYQSDDADKNNAAFGEHGSFVVCDWEMAFVGSAGRDVGIFQWWPICTALVHAAHGREDVATDILACMNEFWDAYAREISEHNGNGVPLEKTFRSGMGWLSCFAVLTYLFGVFEEYLPVEGLSDDQKKNVLAVIGHVGITFLQYAFGGKEPNLTLEELRLRFNDTVASEISELARENRPTYTRRLSLLRSTGRRVSDADVFAKAMYRASLEPSLRRPNSSYKALAEVDVE